MKKMLKKMAFAAVMLATPVLGHAEVDYSGYLDQPRMQDIREDIQRFAVREYRSMGANPFYLGGIPAARLKNDLAGYEKLLAASLQKEGINTSELHEEFMRIACGEIRRATLRNGDPFFTVNQKGGGFVKGPKLGNGRALLKNETGGDIKGALIVLQHGARNNPVIILLADECGNAFLLPPRPAMPQQPMPQAMEPQQPMPQPPQQPQYRQGGPNLLGLAAVVIAAGVAQRIATGGQRDCYIQQSYPYQQQGPQVLGRRWLPNGRLIEDVRLPDGRVMSRCIN